MRDDIEQRTRKRAQPHGVLEKAGLAVLTMLLGAAAAHAQDGLGPVPEPAENPITESKRVLGKILFFDEQLSSDDTVACASCHVMGVAGADPRRAPAPGTDGVIGTADDVQGSPGVVAQSAVGDFALDAVFGLRVQVTGRAANPAVMAMYADELFWDGRATSQFLDPVTGEVVIAAGGALESQAVGPPTSDVEMAHASRDWAQITGKLNLRRPLALAVDLPTDVAAALAGDPSYGDLFADAFGDTAITAARIGMAIATYERTLVPDRTDWDRFVAGDTTALTAAERRGLGALDGSRCLDCHEPPVFSDGSFRNIGVRPVAEDRGRANVTDDDSDRGKFKVPSLRNAALKRSFFHDGRRTTLQQVLAFYARAPGETQFRENQDPVMAQVRVPPPAAADIVAFLQGGLVDERVRNETFPFDRPTLGSEIAPRRPRVTTAGRGGAGGVPGLVAPIPAFSGNTEFRVGLERAAPGSTAVLAVSREAPVAGEVRQDETVGPLTVENADGAGHATARHSLADALGGPLYVQWRVQDATAPGGVALSPAVEITVFAIRGETIDPYVPDPDDGDDGGDGGGSDDGSDGPAVVADDATLHVDRVIVKLDHAAHASGNASDRLDVRGSLNPRGADADPSGALVRLVLGNEEVVPPVALDERGRANTTTSSGSRVKIHLDVSSGAFRVRLSGADLRAAIGIDGTVGSGDVAISMELHVSDLGLATESCATEFGLSWRTGRDRTVARHRYRTDGALSGIFRTTRLQTRDGAAGRQRVRVTALLDGAGDEDIDVSAGLTVQVGAAAAEHVPLDGLRVSRRGKVSLRSRTGALRRLVLDPRKRRVTIDANDLATGLPLFPQTGDRADLTVRVIAGDASDPTAEAYETTVEVTRKRKGWRQ